MYRWRHAVAGDRRRANARLLRMWCLTMPWQGSGDVDIYWESYGRGHTLLLISGVSGGTWSWADEIAAWSPRFRVIVFDNIGAGRSSMPDRPYSIQEMADHAAHILDAAHERRASVVGLSMGGMIAQALTLRHPDRVAALVLGCTHCGGTERIPPAPEVIQQFAANEGLTAEEIVDKNLRLLVTPEFLHSKPESLERYRQRQLEAPLQPDYALQRQLEAIQGFDVCGRLNEIEAATLILTGGRDALVPPENGRVLARLIPGATERCFADAGHLIHLECPEAFHETVMRFVHDVCPPHSTD
ncbi:MAG: alpha/beta fold hydrolase [Syntrophobacteria bacterium]